MPTDHPHSDPTLPDPVLTVAAFAEAPVLPQPGSMVDVSSPPHLPELRASDLRSRRRRRVRLPILLFLATCLSTFYVGASSWHPLSYLGSMRGIWHVVSNNWEQGLLYTIALLGILMTHEMGHFLITLRYKIAASYPLFIPVPFNAIGTMGAVIGMDGMKANRREMFDLGISGPLAGLAVAVPVLWIGILKLDFAGPASGIAFHNPLLGKLLMSYLRPDLPWNATVDLQHLNPFFMAGWVGMLITGLNMLPISQLDGGHVAYTLFRRRAHSIARGFLILAIAFIVIEEVYIWALMLIVVILIGTDHPRTANDDMKLGPARWALGVVSLAIPVLCFSPIGVEI